MGYYLVVPEILDRQSTNLKHSIVELQVKFISPVIWNKQAFERLVVEDDTKELIIALVTNQLVAEKATDLMGGKGNGLIVLLHG